MTGDDSAQREAALAALRRLDALGMNRGSTGNLSLRQGDGMLITPTGMGADDLRAQDLVWLGWDGSQRGDWQPSSEWHFHRAIYAARPDLHAIVHAHPVPYQLFGTEALSAAVAQGLQHRDACLLANHGLVAAGPTLARAMKVAQEIESLCETYLLALAVGEPVLLSRAQMDEVIQRFRSYGQAARKP